MIIPRPLKKVLGKIIPFSQEDKIPTFNLGSGTADNTTYLRGDGTWAAVGGGSGYVPYTGAVTDVDLGVHDLTATQGTFATNGSSNTLTVNHSSGSGKALTITKGGSGEGIYVNKTSGSGNAVTVVGDLEATNLKRTGGTSAQFLKANGSIDSTSYQPTLVSGTNIKTVNGNSLLGSGDITISGGGGITVGTTAVTSGTIGCVFFQGIGDVVQQSSSLFWDNTNSRLGVGATPASTVRLDVRAQGATSTDYALRVRNSVNTKDLLLIRGNGDHEIGATGSPSLSLIASSGYSYPGLTFVGQGGTEKSQIYMTSNRMTFLHTTSNTATTTMNTTGIAVGFGDTGASARIDIKAQGALSTDLALRVRNSANTANILTANGKGLVWSNGPGYVSSNCAFGELAMNANTTGANNTAFGYNALTTATTAGQNTAVGWGAIQLTTGFGNTAIGYGAGQLNAGGTKNTYLGYAAGQLGTTANSSVFIGYAAGQNSNALAAICIGLSSGTNAGNGSIALGYNSGPGTGTNNLSIGQSAGLGMTTGSLNMHLGYRSVASGVTTGNYNTLIGGDIVVGNVSNNAVLADMQGNQAIKKDANHNVVLGKETALATNATNGFAYLPTCDGTPTGVPAASFTGKAPVVIDSTNNKMYIYSGGAWVALN